VNGFSGNHYQGFYILIDAKRAYRRFLEGGKIVAEKKRKPKQAKPLKPNVNTNKDLPPWCLD
jgi:hypothetical protein